VLLFLCDAVEQQQQQQNTTKNDTKPTTSGAWSRFGAVVATAALAALAF